MRHWQAVLKGVITGSLPQCWDIKRHYIMIGPAVFHRILNRMHNSMHHRTSHRMLHRILNGLLYRTFHRMLHQCSIECSIARPNVPSISVRFRGSVSRLNHCHTHVCTVHPHYHTATTTVVHVYTVPAYSLTARCIIPSKKEACCLDSSCPLNTRTPVRPCL